MNEKDVAAKLGSCGKACRLCKGYAYCEGCHSHEALESRRRTRDGCFHYSCCHRKHIEGCWECDEFPCARDLFISDDSFYLSAFVRCIKEDGKNTFAHHAFLRFLTGIKDKDYSDCEDEDAVLQLLTTGKKKVKG